MCWHIMSKMKLTSPVTNGKISGVAAQRLNEFIIAYEGKKVDIEVNKHVERRSLSQNSFYNGFILPPIHKYYQEMGNNYSRDKVHCLLKAEADMFDTGTTLEGERYTFLRSSKTFKKPEWEDFIMKVRAFMAKHPVYLPFPNEHRGSNV